jgi:hypothetical protein
MNPSSVYDLNKLSGLTGNTFKESFKTPKVGFFFVPVAQIYSKLFEKQLRQNIFFQA